VPDRILVVDDDREVRRAYERYLASAGFEVRSAPTLRAALARLARGVVDAVIADVVLTSGGAEGLALATQVRAQLGTRPAVVLTAYGIPRHAAAAARLDVDAFLHKPPSLPWLERLLSRRIADRRRGGVSRVVLQAV
jgi:two-component system phosphate regulon response regulator OmpR